MINQKEVGKKSEYLTKVVTSVLLAISFYSLYEISFSQESGIQPGPMIVFSFTMGLFALLSLAMAFLSEKKLFLDIGYGFLILFAYFIFGMLFGSFSGVVNQIFKLKSKSFLLGLFILLIVIIIKVFRNNKKWQTQTQ